MTKAMGNKAAKEKGGGGKVVKKQKQKKSNEHKRRGRKKKSKHLQESQFQITMNLGLERDLDIKVEIQPQAQGIGLSTAASTLLLILDSTASDAAQSTGHALGDTADRVADVVEGQRIERSLLLAALPTGRRGVVLGFGLGFVGLRLLLLLALGLLVGVGAALGGHFGGCLFGVDMNVLLDGSQAGVRDGW